METPGGGGWGPPDTATQQSPAVPSQGGHVTYGGSLNNYKRLQESA